MRAGRYDCAAREDGPFARRIDEPVEESVDSRSSTHPAIMPRDAGRPAPGDADRGRAAA
jgi:hypothetical protein